MILTDGCIYCGRHGYHHVSCPQNGRRKHDLATTTHSSVSDGSTASYYELPPWARELADLIRYKRMNGSQAEAFRCLYRGSEASHSDEQRQAKKLLCYAVDEVVRTHFPKESFAGYRNRVFEAIFEADKLPAEAIEAATLSTIASQLEAGDPEGALKMVLARLDRLTAENKE